jgi:hypothetical protein
MPMPDSPPIRQSRFPAVTLKLRRDFHL